MNQRRIFCALSLGTAVLLSMTAVSARAAVVGPSNFDGFVYPSHDCGARPLPPEPLSSTPSRMETQDYNDRALAYNQDIETWSQCINGYIERAKLDMQRIHEKQLEAVEEAQ